jgi:hypothetical protein
VNGVNIYHDVEAAVDAYKAENWADFGKNVGAATALVILGEESQEAFLTGAYPAYGAILPKEFVQPVSQYGNLKFAFECDSSVNFIVDAAYQQEDVCGSLDEVLAACQKECIARGCKAMFYQEHNNDLGCPESPAGGFQICSYYLDDEIEALQEKAVQHGHREGSQILQQLLRLVMTYLSNCVD